jgi:hypothetical protein
MIIASDETAGGVALLEFGEGEIGRGRSGSGEGSAGEK